jgi:mRNA-degrading endonuclease toxin of MazEF toxin-antitoxin module
MKPVKRGEIWWVSLEPTRALKFAKPDRAW